MEEKKDDDHLASLQKHQKKMDKLRKEVNELMKDKLESDDEDDSSLSGVSDLDDDELRLRMEELPGFHDEYSDNPIMKAAREFANSDHYRNILKDRITIKGDWERPQYLCTNPERRGFRDEVDLQKAKGVEVSNFELFLLTSEYVWCPDVFPKCLEAARAAKERGEGPQMAHCLAWLSFAAQCAPGKLLPPGEIFPEADDYIQKYLDHPELPLVEERERVDLALCQISRCFEFLSESDLSSLSVSDRSNLLFLISRILIDRAINVTEISVNAKALISQILKTAEDERELLLEFAQIFPHICEDLRGIKAVLEAFRAAKGINPATCLCLMATVFIHVSERAECTPEDPESLSSSDFNATYTSVVTDTLVNVLDIFEEERSQQAAVVSLVDIAMHPDVFFLLDEHIRQMVVDRLEFIKRGWKKKGRTDDVILEMMVSNVISRLTEEEDDAMEVDPAETTGDSSMLSI